MPVLTFSPRNVSDDCHSLDLFALSDLKSLAAEKIIKSRMMVMTQTRSRGGAGVVKAIVNNDAPRARGRNAASVTASAVP